MLEKEKIVNAALNIVERLNEHEKISNFELLEICRKQGIESIAGGSDYHLTHEILEVAINKHISKENFQQFARITAEAPELLARLERLEGKIPVQSWRSDDQQKLQQFSTPPPIAFLMTKILNPSEGDLILEPSAGTGSLAIWLRIFSCRIHLNELSERRRALLELQGYVPTGFDAEFLDDLLPEEIKPDAVLMNPPFSSSAGRTKTNDSNFGFRHIRSALSRLKTNGKLVALMGTESATKTDKGRKFWSEIAAAYEPRAFIHLPKNAFYKYGTSIGTSIVCIVKNEATYTLNRSEKRKSILEITCKTLDECLKYADVFN